MEHQKGVMEIYNYYVENGTAAFPSQKLPEQFYPMLLKKAEGYPAYVLIDSKISKVIGFCMLSQFLPFSSFQGTACLTYFFAPDYTGNGLGSICLAKLENEARKKGIDNLIADISSDNTGSVSFHKKHGFSIAGELLNVGNKHNKSFGIVYMQKQL